MKEVKGNLWNAIGRSDAVVITTNGCVRRDGRAVMGAGVAFQARRKFYNIDKDLGTLIKNQGSKVQIIRKEKGTSVVSFPVKPIIANPEQVLPRLKKPGNHIPYMTGLLSDKIPGWAAMAETSIIEESCKQLVILANEMDWKRVALPWPGCGNGELNYNTTVRPILLKYLNDKKFYVIEWGGGKQRKNGKGTLKKI